MMKRKDYTKPEVQIVNLKMSGMLMTSITETTSGGDSNGMSSGSFGARGNNSFWDDDDE